MNKTTIKASNFDFTQMLNKKLNVYLEKIVPVLDNEKTIINYNLIFSLEKIPNALVKYTLYKLDKDNYAKSLKVCTSLQLNALNLLQKEKINGYYTGNVIFSLEDIKNSIGKCYQAQLYLIDSVDNGKKYQWKFLLPSNADTSILEQIREMQESKKISDDIMDKYANDLVSFDSLRDSELNELN